MLEKGMKCKQKKEIEGFRRFEDTFTIVNVSNGMVFFKNLLGYGAITEKDFDEYFEVIPEKKPIVIKQGDKCKIIKGIFTGIECTIHTVFGRTVVVKTIDGVINNYLTVHEDDLELIKPKVPVEVFNCSMFIEQREYKLQVKIRGRRTTVTILETKDRGSVYCHVDDKYDRTEGIHRAFKKAVVKSLQKEINR